MESSNSCEFPKFNATSRDILNLLASAKTIAVVGLSPNPSRPSYEVSLYIKSHGYRILPVNPGHREILGERCYSSLMEIDVPIDIVDIFRRPEAVPDIVEEAIAKKAKAIWMQEGIVHNEAAERAKKAGLMVVMNKCILKEHAAAT